MKIGILTFHFSENYGAMLQAYCLQAYLRSLGHTVEFINYHPYYVEQGGSLRDILNIQITRKYLKTLYLFVGYYVRRMFYRSSKMLDFQASKLMVSHSLFRSADSFDYVNLKYDAIIIGSDQLWNPSEQYGLDEVYYGVPFLRQKIPVFTYAVSFGSIENVLPFKSRIVELCKNINKISVRERVAQSWLRECDIDSSWVPDPTVLVECLPKSNITANPNPFEKRIFVYALRNALGFSTISLAIARKYSLNIYSAYTPWRRWKKIGKELLLTPLEFVDQISSSQIVLSNSFHGIVVSILEQTPFIAVSLPNSKKGLSSRLNDFLESVGLTSRLIQPCDLNSALDIVEEPINWTLVYEKIVDLRCKGRSYIDNILS